MDRVETDNGGERLGIVNDICLGEAVSNQTSLVMCSGTIKIIFESEDPLAHENIVIC